MPAAAVRSRAPIPDASPSPSPSSSSSSSSPSPPKASFAEHVCLTLVVQGVSHGWALGTLLSPDGQIGRVWTLSRPLTYRAIDGLLDKRLITRRGVAAGQGRDRVVLAATAAGRRLAARWLDTPVAHLRDVRTELLVKLVLRTRAGFDNADLLSEQRRRFDPAIAGLTSTHPNDDVVDVWRRESARAVRRFLDEALHPSAPAPSERPEMRLSARNQMRGTVTAVHHGEVMSTIKTVLGDGQQVTAAITEDAAEDLDLAPGDDVVVIVKSTEVIVAKT